MANDKRKEDIDLGLEPSVFSQTHVTVVEGDVTDLHLDEIVMMANPFRPIRGARPVGAAVAQRMIRLVAKAGGGRGTE